MKKILKENPDTLDVKDPISGEKIWAMWLSDDPYVFGYYKKENKRFYIKSGGNHSYNIFPDDVYTEFVKKNQKRLVTSRDDFEYAGRLWNDLKIISFWDYPKNYRILKKIMNDINKHGIKINDDWWIEVVDNGMYSIPKLKATHVTKKFWDEKSKLVRIKDYIGSDKQIGKEIQHNLSPMLKNKISVPKGVGSKKPVPGAYSGEVPAQTIFRTRKGLGDGIIKLKDLILERTFKINADVDYIYKKGGFQKFIKEFNKRSKDNDFPNADDISKYKQVKFGTINSSELKTIDSKKAHSVNPITIECGINTNSSYYRPIDSKINISFTYSALKVFADNMVNTLPKYQLKIIYNEITEERIKATISHELSHWIDDSLHNKHITNKLNLNSKDAILLNKKNVNMTYFEIDAQIHGIKQLKRKYKDMWDKFNLIDIYKKYTALYSIATLLYNNFGQDVLNIWQKSLLKRMAREKLLGNNMNSFVNGEDLR